MYMYVHIRSMYILYIHITQIAIQISSTILRKLFWRSFEAENVNKVLMASQQFQSYDVATLVSFVVFIIVDVEFYKMETILFNIIC
jgi:hypothetical protein